MNIHRIKKGFSLIELSIVIVIIGILVAGITNGIDMYSSFKLQVARNQTRNSIVFRSNDLMLWYESTSESSFSVNGKDVSTPNDRDIISRWRDLNKVDEGLKNHAKAYHRTRYIANAINGLPAVGFGSLATSSTDWGYLDINIASLYNLKQPKTIFVVFLPLNNTNNNAKHLMDNTVCATQNKIMFSTSNQKLEIYAGSSASSANYSTQIGKAHLLSLVQNGSSSYYKINKVSSSVVNLGNNSLTSTIRLGNSCGGGAGDNFNGYIGEFIIFDSLLNDSYISKVEEYLSKKWSL